MVLSNLIIHDLRIEDNYLHNLRTGQKKVEIRLNDRDYQVGDILLFSKYHSHNPDEHCRFEITHIHSGLGMSFNYVALSVRQLKEGEA